MARRNKISQNNIINKEQDSVHQKSWKFLETFRWELWAFIKLKWRVEICCCLNWSWLYIYRARINDIYL